MTEKQIKDLKGLVENVRVSQLGSKEREEYKTQIVAYLAGCLSGID